MKYPFCRTKQLGLAAGIAALGLLLKGISAFASDAPVQLVCGGAQLSYDQFVTAAHSSPNFRLGEFETVSYRRECSAAGECTGKWQVNPSPFAFRMNNDTGAVYEPLQLPLHGALVANLAGSPASLELQGSENDETRIKFYGKFLASSAGNIASMYGAIEFKDGQTWRPLSGQLAPVPQRVFTSNRLTANCFESYSQFKQKSEITGAQEEVAVYVYGRLDQAAKDGFEPICGGKIPDNQAALKSLFAPGATVRELGRVRLSRYVKNCNRMSGCSNSWADDSTGPWLVLRDNVFADSGFSNLGELTLTTQGAKLGLEWRTQEINGERVRFQGDFAGAIIHKGGNFELTGTLEKMVLGKWVAVSPVYLAPFLPARPAFKVTETCIESFSDFFATPADANGDYQSLLLNSYLELP